MVHITNVKKTTLTEHVADDCEELGKQGRFIKKCIPRGYISDWTTVHQDLKQPIKPAKQQEDLTETTTTQAAPTEVEGPPTSHLSSPAQTEVNEVQIVPKGYSLM